MSAFADASIIVDECIPLLKKVLEWDNPEYFKKQETGRSTWNTPKKIILWQMKGNALVIPFGMLQFLWKSGIQVVPSEHLTCQKLRFKASVDNLYDYQEKALESALKAKQGVLVAPCGSGKTQIGLAICGALGFRTLWLTHTHELLKQSMDRAKACLGEDVPMGTITEGKINASDGITFATVQTMARINLSDFHDFFDVVIVDEAHRCVGTPTSLTMFYKVVSSLSARYKYGLTATPKRTDGMEKAMFALLGEKFFEISKKDVQDKTCPLSVTEPVQTHYEPCYDEVLNPDGTLNYVNLITDCVNDKERNKIVSFVIDTAVKTGKTMVLSERVAHLENLAEMCHHRHVILSTAKKKEREGILKGDWEVMFATYQIAKEGLDIPSLINLVMASPVKNDITVTQSVGRVMRAFPDKEYGYVWDFDDDMPMLKRWLSKRLSIYRRLQK